MYEDARSLNCTNDEPKLLLIALPTSSCRIFRTLNLAANQDTAIS